MASREERQQRNGGAGAIQKRYDALSKAKPSYYTPDTEVYTIKAPIKGWNAFSPLAAMEPEFATSLINWVPRPGWVELRGGYANWVLALGGSANPVNSLMVYRPSTTDTETMFAASGTSIYNVSTQGTGTAVVTSLSNNTRWQYVNFTPAGGTTTLVIVNGQDAVHNYNGSSWTTPTITGATSSTFITVHSHMRRLWFVSSHSTVLWYLPIDSISGAVSSLDIGPFLTKGGYVIALKTWTVDGGNGPTALLVAMSTQGQVVIYQGTDPSATFTLVGVFDLAWPVGRRCMVNIGSDVGIITLEGLIPISKALPFNPAALRSVAFTANIQNAVAQVMQSSSTNFGWETILYPSQSLMIMNVPIAENSQQVQYVMNTITQAWCQFTGWNANTFAIFNESLYFGDNTGNVQLAYTGRLDGGAAIYADLECAYNNFREPAKVKYIGMVKPFLITDGSITPSIGFNIDFVQNTNITSAVQTVSQAGAMWDVSLWDVGVWGGGQISEANWQGSTALGTWLGLRMVINYSTSSQGTLVESGENLPVLQVAEFLAMGSAGGPI